MTKNSQPIDKRLQKSYNGYNELVILGGNVLEVDIDKILPVTEARDNFNKIIDEVEGSDSMFVLTKNGKPSAVIVGVNHLEKLTGKTADELTSIVEKKADTTPVVEEVTPPTPLGDNVAGGSKPLETAANATGQSIQVGNATDSTPTPSNTEGSLDVPADIEAPVPDTTVAAMPAPAPAPTSSPGGTEPLNVAPNQAPAADPTENGTAANDSDLFV